jgi:hypothetical protein
MDRVTTGRDYRLISNDKYTVNYYSYDKFDENNNYYYINCVIDVYYKLLVDFIKPYQLITTSDKYNLFVIDKMDELGIYSVGNNLNEVILDFIEDFMFAYRSYAIEDDSKLTASGIKIKNKINSIVKVEQPHLVENERN